MRIMMVSAHYPPVLNGYAIQCKRTTEIFKKRGHQVCVLTSSVNSSYIEKDMRVLRILKSFPLEGYQSLQPIYILRQLKRRKVYQGNRLIAQGIAREFKPQVIMVWQFDSLGFGLIYGLQKLGIPIVFNVEDYGLHAIVSRLRKDPNPFWRMARRRLYQVHVDDLDISHLIMASEELKDFYINEGFPEDHITVVHNAIDSEYIAEKSPKLGLGNKLLYAGRIHPTKGIEIAIKALAILNAGTKGRFTLDIVGTGEIDYVRKLADLGRSLSLEASLQFLGPKDREVLIDLYREYDMLLFPSVWHEPFGLTVIEAMARGSL